MLEKKKILKIGLERFRSLVVHVGRTSTFHADPQAKALGQEGTNGARNGSQK